MEKLVLFPLNNDTEVLINNLEENQHYQIAAVSSYYEDKKRLELLQKDVHFFCSTDFEKCLEEADTVVFSENTMGYSYDGYGERVQQAQKAGKKILMSGSLAERLDIDIGKSDIRILQDETLPQDLEQEIIIKEIDVCIISIMGMGENCDKFSLQAKVKGIIEKQGYSVLAVCSNVLGKFMGMEILPGFLFSKNMSYPEKIKSFNLWLCELQRQKKSDVILLGCPGGISKFDSYETNYWGEIPLILANAVSIDSGFINLYGNMEQSEESVKKLSDFSAIKYNTEVRDYIFSKNYFHSDYEARRIRYYTINKDESSKIKIEDISDFHLSYIENDLKIEEQVKIMLTEFQNNFLVI